MSRRKRNRVCLVYCPLNQEVLWCGRWIGYREIIGRFPDHKFVLRYGWSKYNRNRSRSDREWSMNGRPRNAAGKRIK